MSANPDTKIKAVMHIALPPILDIVTYSAFISESLIDENIEGRPDLVTLYKSFQDIHHALDNDIKYENKNIPGARPLVARCAPLISRCTGPGGGQWAWSGPAAAGCCRGGARRKVAA